MFNGALRDQGHPNVRKSDSCVFSQQCHLHFLSLYLLRKSQEAQLLGEQNSQSFSLSVTSVFYFASSPYQWCGWDTTQAHRSGTEPCAIKFRASMGQSRHVEMARPQSWSHLQPGIEPPRRAISTGVMGKSSYHFPEAHSGVLNSALSFKN